MAALKKQGLSIQEIADHMGRHRSAIYREFARNSCYLSMVPIGLEKLNAEHAHDAADQGAIIIIVKLTPE